MADATLELKYAIDSSQMVKFIDNIKQAENWINNLGTAAKKVSKDSDVFGDALKEITKYSK
nr:hypothetical protein [Candidatus Brocadiales bacterium]